jgi:hypothetical protein
VLKSQIGSLLWKTSDTEEDINRAWETISESLGYNELKKHKPWFNEGWPKLLDHRKQAKLQWLQDPKMGII